MKHLPGCFFYAHNLMISQLDGIGRLRTKQQHEPLPMYRDLRGHTGSGKEPAYWGYRLTFPTVSRGETGSKCKAFIDTAKTITRWLVIPYKPQMVLLVNLVKHRNVDPKNRVLPIVIGTKAPKNWEDNGGCLPALDAGGHRFESYFPDNAGMAEWQTRQI